MISLYILDDRTWLSNYLANNGHCQGKEMFQQLRARRLEYMMNKVAPHDDDEYEFDGARSSMQQPQDSRVNIKFSVTGFRYTIML